MCNMIKLAEILDEYTVKKPIKSWKLNSDDYKSFYQLTKYCYRWGITWDDVDSYDFNNDYYFFVAIFHAAEADHIKPDYCTFTEKDLFELAENFSLDFIEDPSNPDEWKIDYNDPTMKQIVAQLNKHAGRK